MALRSAVQEAVHTRVSPFRPAPTTMRLTRRFRPHYHAPDPSVPLPRAGTHRSHTTMRLTRRFRFTVRAPIARDNDDPWMCHSLSTTTIS